MRERIYQKWLPLIEKAIQLQDRGMTTEASRKHLNIGHGTFYKILKEKRLREASTKTSSDVPRPKRKYTSRDRPEMMTINVPEVGGKWSSQDLAKFIKELGVL